MLCRAFLIIFALFFSACATQKIEYVPLKCEIVPPIKPNCNDFLNEFNCGKAKGEYINALEKALQLCI